MTIIESFQLLLLLALCIATSVTDIKGGKIPNRYLLFAAAPATVLNVLYYIVYVPNLALNFGINLLVIVIVSVLLYVYRVWAAGDSKLLIMIVYLLPARIFYPASLSLSPTVEVIILTFSMAFVYLIFESIFLGIREKSLFSVKQIKLNAWKFIGQYLLSTLYLVLFNEILYIPSISSFAINNPSLVMLANMLLILSVANVEAFKNKILIGISIAAAVGLMVLEKGLILSAFNYLLLALSLAVILIRLFAEKYNYRIIFTSTLKKGMVLSWASIALFAPSKIHGLPNSTTEDMDSRLTDKQVEDIKRWGDSKYGQPELSIVRKLPFAIFISVGVIVFSIVRLIAYGR